MKGFLFSTRRQDPQDAQVDSHRLMVRAGLIEKLGAGLYHILPMGLRSLRKIENIVRQEMDQTGAYEFELPILVPATLWQKSGRYDIMGKELFRIKDRHDNWNVLGPTHEETFTDLMSSLLKSYKDLPVNVYQIHTKFRDEIRPRFGVIRSREFIMKDAYSFHNDQESLNQTYQDMRLAYRRIFARAGLETIPVEADTGSMGGSGSEEFMVPSQIGEETLLLNESRSYRSNQEKTPVIYPDLNIEELAKINLKDIENKLKKIHTPNTKTIEALADFLKLNTNQILKTILYRVEYSGNKAETVMVLIRGDRQLHEIKLKNHLGALEIAPAANSGFEAIGSVAGFAGPLNLKSQVRVIFDTSVATNEKWVTGANQVDYHYENFYPVLVDENWHQQLIDVSLAVDGDLSPDGNGILSSVKGIEVGHIFKLGDKYTKAMSMTVLNENQKPINPLMGCYGIGLNRTMATVIEQNFDDKGIIWPMSVAPFEMVMVDICKTDEDRKKVEHLYQQLIDAGFDLLWDNRDLRPGVKFNDAELIGFPIRLTAGKNLFESGKIEIVVRKSGQKTEIEANQLIDELNRIRHQLLQEMPEVPI